jgi:hypothetical protein
MTPVEEATSQDAVTIPLTGDPAVDEAMELLREPARAGATADGQVLGVVHDMLQRRLRATTE